MYPCLRRDGVYKKPVECTTARVDLKYSFQLRNIISEGQKQEAKWYRQLFLVITPSSSVECGFPPLDVMCDIRHLQAI